MYQSWAMTSCGWKLAPNCDPNSRHCSCSRVNEWLHRFGMKQATWLAIPGNWRTPLTSTGSGRSMIALTLSGSGKTPPRSWHLLNTLLKTLGTEIFQLRVTPTWFRQARMSVRCWSSSLWSLPGTRVLSIIMITLVVPSRSVDTKH